VLAAGDSVDTGAGDTGGGVETSPIDDEFGGATETPGGGAKLTGAGETGAGDTGGGGVGGGGVGGGGVGGGGVGGGGVGGGGVGGGGVGGGVGGGEPMAICPDVSQVIVTDVSS
jgi:hypothetical protein